MNAENISSETANIPVLDMSSSRHSVTSLLLDSDFTSIKPMQISRGFRYGNTLETESITSWVYSAGIARKSKTFQGLKLWFPSINIIGTEKLCQAVCEVYGRLGDKTCPCRPTVLSSNRPIPQLNEKLQNPQVRYPPGSSPKLEPPPLPSEEAIWVHRLSCSLSELSKKIATSRIHQPGSSDQENPLM